MSQLFNFLRFDWLLMMLGEGYKLSHVPPCDVIFSFSISPSYLSSYILLVGLFFSTSEVAENLSHIAEVSSTRRRTTILQQLQSSGTQNIFDYRKRAR
jgi:hypothetical protein